MIADILTTAETMLTILFLFAVPAIALGVPLAALSVGGEWLVRRFNAWRVRRSIARTVEGWR